jgi:hypothetical protein
MSGRFSLMVIVLYLSAAANAGAACPPKQAKNCVDLDGIPQIAGQIVAGEKYTPPPAKAPFEDATAASGPIIGMSDKLRRAPEIGYRWAIH